MKVQHIRLWSFSQSIFIDYSHWLFWDKCWLIPIKNISEAMMNLAAGWEKGSVISALLLLLKNGLLKIIYSITSSWRSRTVHLFFLWAHCPCHAGSLWFGCFSQGSMLSHRNIFLFSLTGTHSELQKRGAASSLALCWNPHCHQNRACVKQKRHIWWSHQILPGFRT